MNLERQISLPEKSERDEAVRAFLIHGRTITLSPAPSPASGRGEIGCADGTEHPLSHVWERVARSAGRGQASAKCAYLNRNRSI
jgi:hypothetical protein